MSKISVIIPVYNTEEFLPTCLDSILEQSYKNLEIILLNNESTDKSQQIIDNYSKLDERIISFKLDGKKGVGASRNFGIDQATGDYIFFLDSDDYLPKDTLKILINNIGNHEMIRGKIHSTHFSNSFSIVVEGFIKPKLFTDNKYDLIRNNSVVNYLFKTNFIKKNHLRFSENLIVYSDLQFLIPALINVKEIPYLNQAIYFKRNRHDPISNPSLGQYNLKVKVKDFLKMFTSLRNNHDDNLANKFLDRHLLNFYRKEIVNFLSEVELIDDIYEELTNSISKVNFNEIKEQDFLFRKELKTIRKGNLKSFKKLFYTYKVLRDFRKSIHSTYQFKIFLYNHLFSKLPVQKNLVFFESFLGKNYSDNPKYIYEYLQTKKNNYNYKMVWSFNTKKEIPGSSLQVKRFSLRYFYYLGRAKYWVNNARMPNDIKKRTETVYLQTWHGTPLKRLAGDMENVHMPGTNPETYRLNFKNETEQWDYLVSPNSYSSQIFRRAFWFNNNLLEFGYPRNDILYKKNNASDIKEIKHKMKLPNDKRVILYAPTWRDDEYYSKGSYKFSLKFDLNKMQKKLGDKYIIILRMHYLIASKLDISKYKDFVYDYSAYDDISELYLVSDILITDYSSVFFDYANLKRPILFFTYDIEKYRDQLRGFYLDIETEVPGPLLMSTDEIIQSIIDIDKINQSYKDRYDLFYKRFCEWDDGNASENIVQQVFKCLKSNR